MKFWIPKQLGIVLCSEIIGVDSACAGAYLLSLNAEYKPSFLLSTKFKKYLIPKEQLEKVWWVIRGEQDFFSQFLSDKTREKKTIS